MTGEEMLCLFVLTDGVFDFAAMAGPVPGLPEALAVIYFTIKAGRNG